MGGTFHFYFDAARSLWDTPLETLYSMAKGAEEDPLTRAARATLRMKADFMTPDAYAGERAALTKLATTLEHDPDFTMDLALRLHSRGKGATAPAPSRQRRSLTERPERRGWRVTLWVAVTAAALLLVLDVLATAGVPVPTPIGELIDRFSGEETVPPVESAPQVTEGSSGSRAYVNGSAGLPLVTRASAWRSMGASASEKQRAEGKNVRHSNGKERNFAKGREQHFANGRERNEPAEPQGKASAPVTRPTPQPDPPEVARDERADQRKKR